MIGARPGPMADGAATEGASRTRSLPQAFTWLISPSRSATRIISIKWK